MERDIEYSHPLYVIAIPAKGCDSIPRDALRNPVFQKGFNETRGNEARLMQEYISPKGMRRTTLSNEVINWLKETCEGHVRILAGYGLAWIRFSSKRDAALFKVFYL
jgi:hypothetical protein